MVVWCSTGVVLEWCFCGGVFSGGVVSSTGVVFFWSGAGGVVVFLFWCGE